MDRIRVLCVDDVRDTADTTAELLRLAGFESRACYDGAGALTQAELFRPDVCVIDLGMPGLDGRHLAVWLRARAAGRPMGLIALTGWTREQIADQATAAGFDVVLTKPADPAHLVDTVRDLNRWVRSTGNGAAAELAN